MSNYIISDNMIIKILCKEEIYYNLKLELEDYFKFINNSSRYDFSIYIYTEYKKYDIAQRKIIADLKYKNLKYFRDRESIVIINENKKEIIIFYKEMNDNVIQFISEIIVSIFGMILERKNYFFIHAACVEKNGKAVAIIGNRNSGKTTLLNVFLQEKFNFICNSHLGMSNKRNLVKVIGMPTRMGMRIETLQKIIKPEIRNKIILNTEFNEKFGHYVKDGLKMYFNKKFNIKLNEAKEIYNVKLIKSANLKLIIIPMYNEQFTKMRIKKISNLEKNDVFLSNKRNGIYDTVKYLKVLDKEHKTISLPTNLDKIEAFKIYQNENNINELLDFVNLKLNE